MKAQFFNVVDEIFHDRTGRPVVGRDASHEPGNEQSMSNEEFRIPGLHILWWIKVRTIVFVNLWRRWNVGKHACQIGVKASSITHAGTYWKKVKPTEAPFNGHWTFFQFQNAYSRREDFMATDMGKFLNVNIIWPNNLKKRCIKIEFQGSMRSCFPWSDFWKLSRWRGFFF